MGKGRMVRRPFALVLSVFMVMTMLSGVSFAAEEAPGQDSGEPDAAEGQPPVLDSNAQGVITGWKWVDEDGALMWDGERSAWVLVLAADADNPVDKGLVLDVLPKEILATMADGTEKKIGVVWDPDQLLDRLDGRVWAGSYTVYAYPTEGMLGEKVSLPQFILILDNPTAQALTYEDLEPYRFRGITPQNTTVNLFDYWIETEDPTKGETGSDKTPGHHIYRCTADYNDYWNKTLRLTVTDPAWWNNINGINYNHLLLFGNTLGHAGLWNRGAGQSNEYGKNYAGMEEIVEPLLENGYPNVNVKNAKISLTNYPGSPYPEKNPRMVKYCEIVGEFLPGIDHYTGANEDGNYYPNLSDTVLRNWNKDNSTSITGKESLSYLFDPNEDCKGKKSYTDVDGLFQLDEAGYYYYNVRQNFAELVKKEGDNHFLLYTSPATFRTDGDEQTSVGNFFPFNTGDQVFQSIKDGKPTSGDGRPASNNSYTGISCEENEINHYMGMTVETTFRQPLNGKIQMGTSGTQPMTFQFSGDDDVWVFIDDVLVLDIGGVHSELYGTIDFSTGEVYVGRAFDIHGIPGVGANASILPSDPRYMVNATTLRECFEDANAVDTTNWRTNGDGSITTFASNTTHTLKMFYLERGNYDSSLALRFNLQPLLYQQMRKVDQDGQPLKDVEFSLYPAEEVTDPVEIERIKDLTAQQMKAQGIIACDNKDGVTNPDGVYYVKQLPGDRLTYITTDENGAADFVRNDTTSREDQKDPFNFSDNYHEKDDGTKTGKYYVLKETTPPTGYRTPPLDIALEFDPVNTMITVANRWSVGAYASFVDNIQGTSDITYGRFQDGQIQPDDTKRVPAEKQQNGLILAVPMIRDRNDENNWNAAYGDNIGGFSVVKPTAVTASEWRRVVLEAALMQCVQSIRPNSTVDAWNLGWKPSEGRLSGRIEGLPGVASRYLLQNSADTSKADMRVVFGIITPEGLKALGIDPNNYTAADDNTVADQTYKALGKYILQQAGGENASVEQLEAAVKTVAGAIKGVTVTETGSGEAFSFLNVDQFERSFRSLLFISNDQRELRVRKVDQNNRPVQGATFGIFEDEACTKRVSDIGTTDDNGDLVFAPYSEGHANEGNYAHMEWVTDADDMTQYGARFYLKEISAPEGYELNPTVVPVVVGFYSIYADAGNDTDGVSVMAGVGKLSQTMKKYAQDPDVNIALRDIRAYAQKQESGSFDLYGWKYDTLEDTGSIEDDMDGILEAGDPELSGIKRYMNLHYGLNAVVDYGLHDQDGGKVVNPFFTTETGFLRAKVYQNSADSQAVYDPNMADYKDFEQLERIDLTNIFSLLNIVVITDPKPEDQQGSILLSKHIIGENLADTDYTRNFGFRIELTGADGTPLPGEYHFYGTDKNGTIRSGGELPLHHDEEIVIRGLPYGTRYKVTELRDAQTTTDFPYVVPSRGTAEGQITEEQPHIALPFINSKDPVASFRIEKTVTGNAGEEEKDFHFTVTLRDENGRELAGSYLYAGDINGHLRSGDTITLRHSQSVTIEGLPIGAGYTVTEREADQDGYATTVTGAAGSDLTEAETPVAHFVNHRDVTAFTIQKTVTGTGGEQNRDFHFTVVLRDKDGRELTGSYPYTGSKTGEIRSGGVITLRHGQSVTIGGLPVGAGYVVTEQEADRNGYTTTATGDTGSGLTVDEVPIASFVNHRDRRDDDDDDDDPDPEDPKEPEKPDGNNPRTDDITETGGWAALSLAFLAGMAGILYWRWRKKNAR